MVAHAAHSGTARAAPRGLRGSLSGLLTLVLLVAVSLPWLYHTFHTHARIAAGAADSSTAHSTMSGGVLQPAQAAPRPAQEKLLGSAMPVDDAVEEPEKFLGSAMPVDDAVEEPEPKTTLVKWPLSMHERCQTRTARELHAECHACGQGKAAKATRRQLVSQLLLPEKMRCTAHERYHAALPPGTPAPACRCAQSALPPAAPRGTDNSSSSSSLHACYTYVQSVTNTSQMTLSGSRVCGAADCSTAVAQGSTAAAGDACGFSMLVRDLPRHLYPTRGAGAHTACEGAAADDSPLDVRTQAATPVLCTGEAGVHARYRQQFYRDLEEIFPLVDEGVERRMHGLLELEGGCFMGEVCKEQLAMKTEPLPGHPSCTGFSWQQASNGSHCLKAYRSGNREVCELTTGKRKRVEVPKLVVRSVAPWNTFQHFVLDKLSYVIAAWQQLRDDPDVHFLIHVDKRDLELIRFLGIPKQRIIAFHPEIVYCAGKMMYVDTELPGKYGGFTHDRFPRPPELFLDSARFIQARSYAIRGLNAPPERDLIVYLGRGNVTTAQKGSDVDNLQDVLATIECFTSLNSHLNLRLRNVNPASLSIADLVRVMSRARVVVGVHGGQMSNIIFTQPDRRTAVIEIVGRQHEFKAYHYGGWAGALSYYYVPRLCLTPQKGQALAAVHHAWGKPNRGYGTNPFNCGPNKGVHVYASLDDLWDALGHATGVLDPAHTRCVRPRLQGGMRHLDREDAL